MNGITDLSALLAGLSPRLQRGEYAFCSVPHGARLPMLPEPLATFRERESLSLVVPIDAARAAEVDHEGPFRLITLEVRSSLHAVGLTAAVARGLANEGIGANVIAGYHHDHILVPSERADDAIAALKRLSTVT
jgi:hypothetical protein